MKNDYAEYVNIMSLTSLYYDSDLGVYVFQKNGIYLYDKSTSKMYCKRVFVDDFKVVIIARGVSDEYYINHSYIMGSSEVYKRTMHISGSSEIDGEEKAEALDTLLRCYEEMHPLRVS